MIQHTLENGKTLLFVEVEDYASNFSIDGAGDSLRLSFYLGGWDWIKLNKANWQLLGDSRKITEAQFNLLGITPEAYASLKQMLGVVDVNPLGEDFEGDLNMNDWEKQARIERQWNNAQQQVKRYVLLINQK